ncbi:10021_t:CDS:2 [Gigaspora margarita]|uniref:10021_t:CDS:1 n=1 Tax=Gigaspora margarita TaxID=4874 RepID=A0ABM8VY29_GIGMA|nr:10021_t:CDS:2 [Gigaspora margarita]
MNIDNNHKELLINIEIKEELDFFVAFWEDGIRTIKKESGRHERSRTKSYVDLIKLHHSSDDINKVS